MHLLPHLYPTAAGSLIGKGLLLVVGAGLHLISGSASAAELSGTWDATFADALLSGSGQATLIQLADGSVEGTWISGELGHGHLRATMSGELLTGSITALESDCSGSFTFELNIGAAGLVGSYTGTSCQGDHGNGVLTLLRGASGSTEEAVDQPPKIEQGSVEELAEVRKIYVETGTDLETRIRLVEALRVYRALLEVVDSANDADAILLFFSESYSPGAIAWIPPQPNIPGYNPGVTGFSANIRARRGHGYLVRKAASNTLRVIWSAEIESRGRQKEPETKLVRRLIEELAIHRNRR